MVWSWTYLALTLLGAIFVLNAYHPPRQTSLMLPSFFAGWYTGELPLFHIAWQLIVTLLFIFTGAFSYLPAYAGLVVAVLSWASLGYLSLTANRAHTLLTTELSTLSLEPALTGKDTMWRFPRLLLPFPHPIRQITTIRNINYAGDHSHRHTLDIRFNSTTPPDRSPVLLYIHGGAWIFGDKREQGLPLLYELSRRDWVTVSINYGLSPRSTWPDHLIDCKRALVWVREHITDYGGDPDFIAVSGGSAGGQLAAMLALTPNDPTYQPGFESSSTTVQAAIPFYGVYDMTAGATTSHLDKGFLRLLEKAIIKRSYATDPDAFLSASPLTHVNPKAPPFFVLHGKNDTMVNVAEAREFISSLRETSNSPVVYAELPYTQHAFDILPSIRTSHAIAAVIHFLETTRITSYDSLKPNEK